MRPRRPRQAQRLVTATARSLTPSLVAPAALISIYDSTGQHHEVVKANVAAAAAVAVAAAGALIASVELTRTHRGEHQDESRINQTLEFRCIEIS